MAQLVFVHGVATRDTAEYKAQVNSRNALFRELLFHGVGVDIHSPLWGDFVPLIGNNVFNTNHGLVAFELHVGAQRGPGPGMGMGVGLGAGLAAGGAPDDDNDVSILGLGKQDPIAALDTICAEIADRVTSENRPFNANEMQAFRNASALIAAGTSHTLFTETTTREGVVAELTKNTPGAYGILDVVGAAVTATTDRIKNAAATLGFGAIREKLSPAVAQFFGDVFVYMKEGERRDQIRSAIRKALNDAHGAKQAGKGPIVVVGHSLGGVILIDMLNDLKAAGLPEDIEIDALLTVGSQPGLFASLNVLTPNALVNGLPDAQRRRPDAVKLWLNVFDAIDPFAFRTDTIFQGVEDLVFNSMAGILETHSKYFERPQFYARARKRLQDAGILGVGQ